MTTPYKVRHHHHRGGAATERESARGARRFANTHAARVLVRLRQLRRATATTLAEEMTLDLYAVRRRLSDLKAAGLIEPVPGRYGFTGSGRREAVYRAVRRKRP